METKRKGMGRDEGIRESNEDQSEQLVYVIPEHKSPKIQKKQRLKRSSFVDNLHLFLLTYLFWQVFDQTDRLCMLLS